LRLLLCGCILFKKKIITPQIIEAIRNIFMSPGISSEPIISTPLAFSLPQPTTGRKIIDAIAIAEPILDIVL